jgi:hypothetical protein
MRWKTNENHKTCAVRERTNYIHIRRSGRGLEDDFSLGFSRGRPQRLPRRGAAAGEAAPLDRRPTQIVLRTPAGYGFRLRSRSRCARKLVYTEKALKKIDPETNRNPHDNHKTYVGKQKETTETEEPLAGLGRSGHKRAGLHRLVSRSNMPTLSLSNCTWRGLTSMTKVREKTAAATPCYMGIAMVPTNGSTRSTGLPRRHRGGTREVCRLAPSTDSEVQRRRHQVDEACLHPPSRRSPGTPSESATGPFSAAGPKWLPARPRPTVKGHCRPGPDLWAGWLLGPP